MFQRENVLLWGAVGAGCPPFTTFSEVHMGKKKAVKKAVKKKVKKAAKKKTKRKPNPQFMKPVAPDAKLAAVVGSKPLPRTELTKKLWAYIKKNGLQDPKNRRMINADANLRAVFNGKSKVSMFEMTKLVNKHVK